MAAFKIAQITNLMCLYGNSKWKTNKTKTMQQHWCSHTHTPIQNQIESKQKVLL